MGELLKEIWIDAAPEKVFPYLVEPELLTTWIGEESWNDPRPGGVPSTSAKLVFRICLPFAHVLVGRCRKCSHCH